jgi:hypothetical protein
MNIFDKLFPKESKPEPQPCDCEVDPPVHPLIEMYNEMYCFATTVADSEIEEGNILAKERTAEVDKHMQRMISLFAEI